MRGEKKQWGSRTEVGILPSPGGQSPGRGGKESRIRRGSRERGPKRDRRTVSESLTVGSNSRSGRTSDEYTVGDPVKFCLSQVSVRTLENGWRRRGHVGQGLLCGWIDTFGPRPPEGLVGWKTLATQGKCPEHVSVGHSLERVSHN